MSEPKPYSICVGGMNSGKRTSTIEEARAWVELHNPDWDCVVWYTGDTWTTVVAVYANRQWIM